MHKQNHISVSFLDIGGVLVTNGWDDDARRRAAEKFGLDFAELSERHRLAFDTYELGRLNLDDYLKRVVFHRKRPSTRAQVKHFIFSQSRAFPDTINMFERLARRYNLRVGTISNESRELTDYRVRKFRLGDLIQLFIVSFFIGFRKPDEEIYRIALDVAQVKPQNVLYVDDREMFAEIAADMGMHNIHHRDLDSTRRALEATSDFVI